GPRPQRGRASERGQDRVRASPGARPEHAVRRGGGSPAQRARKWSIAALKNARIERIYLDFRGAGGVEVGWLLGLEGQVLVLANGERALSALFPSHMRRR